MTEEYLQFIWSTKRIIAPELLTTETIPIQIVKPGLHNTILAGPDFSHAQIRMDDIDWHGPIEIHIKSSDWYKHKHHQDPAYDNVILHVVYENDIGIVQNGRTLPTLELKSLIDWEHYEQFEMFRNSRTEIACASFIKETDQYFVESMLTKSVLQKWSEKIKVLQEYIKEPKEAMLIFLGAAFGGHLNMHPFLQTMTLIPSSKLRSMSPKIRYNTLLANSGILNESNYAEERWHFKGNRPGNYPTKRLYQFSHYMHDEQLKLLAELSSPEEVLKQFGEIMRAKSYDLRLSEAFLNHILINAVAPFFNYTAHVNGNEHYREFAIELLRLIPAEKNNIVKKWEKIGIKPMNAWESQGFLALHRFQCKAKKCLSCEIGNTIIKKT